DDTDWFFGTGSSTFIDVAPNFDHTLWNPEGHFLYLDVPEGEVQVAQLLSQYLEGGPQCSFIFYYNMYGSGFGNLSVILRQDYGPTVTLLDMQSNDNQMSGVWQRAHLTEEMLPDEGAFQIILQGKSKNNHQGTIALDDFVFHSDCRLYGSTTTTTPHSTV
ncbi:hypothetical protein OTU49_016487, partial [Cherax quadricarinatus]